MQQARHDRDLVKMHIREQARDFHGVGIIGVAGIALLFAMMRLGKVVSCAQQFGLHARILFARTDVLQAGDKGFFHHFQVNRLIGDFAQGDDRILVVVAVHRDRRAFADHTGTVRSKQHKVKTVRHLLDAVFDGHSGHGFRVSFEPLLICSATRARNPSLAPDCSGN